MRKDESIPELPEQFDVQKELRGSRTPGTDSKMLNFGPNTTINNLVREGDTDRLEKSVMEASQSLNESTTSEKNSNKKKTPM